MIVLRKEAYHPCWKYPMKTVKRCKNIAIERMLLEPFRSETAIFIIHSGKYSEMYYEYFQQNVAN